MSDGAPTVIRADGLRFRYGDEPRPALDGVSFRVRRGEVFGVLGPNGAGKTTLMKILGTVLLHAEGSLEVLGHALPREEEAARRRLGVSFGEFERAFAFRLTGRQNLAYFAAFHGLRGEAARDRVDRALAETGLAEKADALFQHYSTGMKHRLALARALLHEPEILILDEPTTGLDPRTSHELGQTIRRLTQGGVSVVYTTHRLEEAASLCDRVLVLREGKVAAMAAPWDLAALARDVTVLEVSVKGVLPADVDALAKAPGVRGVRVEGRADLRIQCDDVDRAARETLAWLAARGLEVASMATSGASLTDAFLAITEGRLSAAPSRRVEFTVVPPTAEGAS